MPSEAAPPPSSRGSVLNFIAGVTVFRFRFVKFRTCHHAPAKKANLEVFTPRQVRTLLEVSGSNSAASCRHGEVAIRGDCTRANTSWGGREMCICSG